MAGQPQCQLWRVDIGRDHPPPKLTDDVPVKAVSAYSIVGQSVPRVDLPAKAWRTGLCARCARHAAWPRGAAALRRRRRGLCRQQPDRGRQKPRSAIFTATWLLSSETAFDGVVAEQEENAIGAAAQLKVTLKRVTLPDLEISRRRCAQSVKPPNADRQGRRRATPGLERRQN